MQQVFIWSEPELNERIQSPNPKTQQWAVARLFALYPGSAGARTLSLLQSESEAVALATLRQMRREPRPECLPILRQLYNADNPDVRTQTLHVLSNWRVGDAVEWVRDRVLTGTRFSSDEIASMIRLLGLIPCERSYELLKGTESAIQKERSWKWQVFYAALLRHGKSEDMATLISFLLNPEESDEYRTAAIEILLDPIDPTINPSDVFYGNHPAVRQHLLGRLEYLDECTRDTSTPISVNSGFHELAKAIGGLKPGGESLLPPAFLESIAATRPLAHGPSAELFSQSLLALRERSVSIEEEFCLHVLAHCALLRSLFDQHLPAPGPDAPWQEKLDYVLKHPTIWEPGDPNWQGTIQAAPRDALIERLVACVPSEVGHWKSLHAVEMLGELRAAAGASAILAAIQRSGKGYTREVALDALKRMGASIVPELLQLLDSSEASLRDAALDLLAHIPTAQVVDALSTHMDALLEKSRPLTLAAVETIAARELYSLLEPRHRLGEWDIARACVHIARINAITPPSLPAMERDVREAEEYEKASRSPDKLPDSLRLELLCNACGNRYHYLVHELHLHPRGSEEIKPDPEETIPYRQGIVITDDLRCKNCDALNDFALAETTLSQIASHGMMTQAMERLGMEAPRHNPLRRVALPNKESKERSLLEIEQEHLETVQRHPGRPESHLAIGKFYEYVKQYPKAKQAYLLALDMDSKTLEAMAGLARLYHAEGRLHDAYSWIDQCYRELAKGSFYLTESPGEFKSTVREKRREYAREAGIRPDEDSVEIRFKVETSDFPKNRPCPCGSGKKYKLCCMKRESR